MTRVVRHGPMTAVGTAGHFFTIFHRLQSPSSNCSLSHSRAHTLFLFLFTQTLFKHTRMSGLNTSYSCGSNRTAGRVGYNRCFKTPLGWLQSRFKLGLHPWFQSVLVFHSSCSASGFVGLQWTDFPLNCCSRFSPIWTLFHVYFVKHSVNSRNS